MANGTIERVTIVGVGTQGAQIAFRCALYGKQVRIYDLSQEAQRTAARKIDGWLTRYGEEGRPIPGGPAAFLDRITYVGRLAEGVADADLVIEVVPERLELKQKVWSEVDRLAPEHTYLTSNSSSLKSSDMGANLTQGRKEKTFNINFMTPVEDDLVEVMWNACTTQRTREVALTFLYDLKLVPIVTKKEIKGFSHNRVWRAIKKETLKLWEQDYCDYEDMDRAFMLEFGTPYGPFGLMDIVGLDVIRDIELSYYSESGDPADQPPAKLLALIDGGKMGVKTGEGFYRYPHPAYESADWLNKRG